MSRQATVTEADMKRAIKAATACGLTVQECVMTPAEIRLIFIKVDEEIDSDDNPKPKEWKG